MPIINKGILDINTVSLRQTGNDWPTAQVITTSDVIESTSNLYFTAARANAAIYPSLTAANIANFISTVNATVQPFLTTANVVETSGNLYFTAARVNATVQPFLTTANVIETSGNLYFTDARANAAIYPSLTAANIANFASTVNTTVQPFLTTANVIETSSNLYFTNTRAIFATIPAVTELAVTTPVFNYNIDQYVGDNPSIYVSAGETIAFNLNVSGSHPFNIRVSDGGSNYNTGLTHIAQDGTVTTESNAQGKVTGKLFWKIPYVLAGNTYVYQCTNHSSMVGSIVIQRPVSTITTDNVTEGSNLYFTNTKVFNAITIGTITGDIAVTGNLVANGLIIRNIDVTNTILAGNINVGTSTSNIIVTDSITSNIWNGLYTANVIETSGNLYFTNARVVSALIAGDSIIIEANGRISANVASIPLNAAAVNAIVQPFLTTANVIESSANLYFTNTRARAVFSAGDNIDITPQGVISATTQSAVISNDSETIIVAANTLSYTLNRNITDPRSILVIDEGLIQIPTIDYTTAASIITFSTQPAVGSNIEIRYFGIGSISGYSSTFLATVNTFVGTGSNVSFPLSITPVGAAYTSVIIDGVTQQTTAYSIVGSTIEFTEAPVANAVIDVRIYSGTVGSSFNTRTFVGNGVANTYAVTSGFNAQNILIFENGVAQVADVDYTVDANSVITFAIAPAANVVVQIRELGSTTANLINQISGRDLRSGNIEPLVNQAQNLGSANLRYNKIFLSGANSLVIGNTTISISGSTLTLSNDGGTTVVGASGEQGSTNARTLGYNLVFGG